MITSSSAPRTLVVAACCVAGLAVAGMGAKDKLHQTSLSVPGTESARTEALVHRYFGESATFVVLLKGPAKDVRAQGQPLVRTLEGDPRATAISPWSPETIPQLRPTHRSALIFVSFRVDPEEAVERVVPHLEELLAQHVSRPVTAIQSGYPSISSAIQNEAATATRRGELIAIPLVLLVLLLVFRSPVAAAIPLAFGAATVVGSRGILALAANWLSIDAFALTVTTMMGLALGVDYTLLMVSRFREELAAGKPPAAAARATRATAGRTVAFAGGVLLVSMVASALILPGTFLISLAGAVVVVAGFSVALGVLVVPALLTLVGGRIDRWSIGPGGKDFAPARLIDRVLRRPGFAAVLLTVPLLLLALPAISLAVGPPSIDQLPATNRARLNAELVNREVGPGWAGPYVVLAASDSGPITSGANLAELRRWERAVGRVDGVQAVIGPGAIAGRVKPLHQLGRAFLAGGRSGSQAVELQRLGTHLVRAAKGVTSLRSGIARSTYGADLLSAGSGDLEHGAGTLAAGLVAASVGSERVASGLNRVASGTQRIHAGQRRAALAALALKVDVHDAIPRVRRSADSSRRLLRDLNDAQRSLPGLEARAAEASRALDVAALEFQKLSDLADDPRYASALDAVNAARSAVAGESRAGAEPGGMTQELQILEADVARATERAERTAPTAAGGLEQLQEAAPIADRLAGGLGQLERGGQQLDSGAHTLARSTTVLAAGLPALSQGATAVSSGAKKLASGTGSLAGNLGDAYTLSRPLEPGLREAATRSVAGGLALRHQSSRLRHLSPAMFDSGYLNLAVLDGTPPSVRSRVEQTVDVSRGGQAARILVIPKHEGALALDNRLRDAAPLLGRRIGGIAGVTGGRAELHDYARVSKSRLPVVIAIVSLVTLLSLVVILRALLAPALTVLLNLLSVSVAFGALALLAGLPGGAPIGDWSHIDTIGAVAIFAIAFGVSIDYSVFILVRMREQFDRHGDHEEAVWVGVRRTGRVVTGAALMMVAVFATFATSDLAIVSQLGAGLTVAILVDATVIRLVLLPALLLRIGERCWWLPAPLDRLISNLRLT